MSQLPEWCNIEDWGGVTLGKARFIHEQAMLRFADEIDAYKGLKSKAEKLFGLLLGIIIALVGYLVTLPAAPFFAAALGLCSMFAFAAYEIWSSMKPVMEFRMQGRQPRRLLHQQMAGSQSLTAILVSEAMGAQENIEDTMNVNANLSDRLVQTLRLMALAPAVGLAAAVFSCALV